MNGSKTADFNSTPMHVRPKNKVVKLKQPKCVTFPTRLISPPAIMQVAVSVFEKRLVPFQYSTIWTWGSARWPARYSCLQFRGTGRG
jgi:hypothetical protein